MPTQGMKEQTGRKPEAGSKRGTSQQSLVFTYPWPLRWASAGPLVSAGYSGLYGSKDQFPVFVILSGLPVARIKQEHESLCPTIRVTGSHDSDHILLSDDRRMLQEADSGHNRVQIPALPPVKLGIPGVTERLQDLISSFVKIAWNILALSPSKDCYNEQNGCRRTLKMKPKYALMLSKVFGDLHSGLCALNPCRSPRAGVATNHIQGGGNWGLGRLSELRIQPRSSDFCS